jgi:hypothetical protein
MTIIKCNAVNVRLFMSHCLNCVCNLRYYTTLQLKDIVLPYDHE